MRKPLSRSEALSIQYSRRFRWVVVGLLLGFSVSSSVPVLGQTFLEKLESAVRQQLNEAPKTQNQAGATSKGATEEELPAPQPNRSPNANGPARDVVPMPVQSVLENPSGLNAPANGPVPPLELSGGAASSVVSDRRIYLGLEAEELTAGGIGVRVTNVTQDSPAWKAGFKLGDRIMGINGFAIANLQDMVKQLGKTSPGRTVRFLVSRAESNIELVAVLMEAGLAERIAGASLRVGDLSAGDVDGPAWLGVIVNDLTPAFRNQFGLNIFRGAAVTSVSPNSPAAVIGIMAGDAIISVDGVAVESSSDLMNWMLTARPGQAVDITYQRGSAARNSKITLQVNPDSRPAYKANRAEVTDAQRLLSQNNSRYNVAPSPAPLQNGIKEGQSVVPVPPNSNTILPPSGTSVPSPPISSTADGTANVDVAALQREIASLKSELQKANQRLETTQNRLKQILEGLGNN